ncbi:hypothetical protein CRYUN_Cryun33cG0000400 [Craigia yunnanensis]
MKNKISNIVSSLPDEILIEILTYEASNSYTNFVNLKLCCKTFLGASKYDHIFKNVSIKKLSMVPWHKVVSFFILTSSSKRRFKIANYRSKTKSFRAYGSMYLWLGQKNILSTIPK